MRRLHWFIAFFLIMSMLNGCGSSLRPRKTSDFPVYLAGSAEERMALTESVSLSPVKSVTPTRVQITATVLPPQATVTPDLVTTKPSFTPIKPSKSTLSPTVTSSLPACVKAGGHLESGQITTELLRNPLEYRVYLPPCYAEETDQRYPVLYLFHGLHLPVEQWARIGVGEAADRLIAAQIIPPLIVVMPYDPYTSPPEANHYGQAIVEGLVPHIDRVFRTRPDRAHRAVGGLSRGGAWAIHLGLTSWQWFGAVGGHSPAIFSDDYSKLKELVRTIPEDLYPRIYLDIGDRDDRNLIGELIVFEKRLDQLSVPHEWHLFLGYHNEAYWRAHLDQYLIWYAAGW